MSTPAAGDEPALQGPPAFALAVALDLVTRYRLRLTDDRDGRLGPLAGAHVLGAASWTGPRAAFVGFYVPPPDPADAVRDVEERVRAAIAWASERLQAQGPQRCDVLLVALGPVPRVPLPPSAGGVTVGVASVDLAAGTVQPLSGLPPGLPGVGELRAHARRLREGGAAPTLAAVDLAERQTVAGGYAQPVRRAVVTQPVVAYALVGIFAAIWLLETHYIRTVPGIAIATSPLHPNLIDMGAVVNFGAERMDWWRYISAAFLHDPTSIVHVLLNSLSMVVIGRLVEPLYGRLVLLGTFVITAVGANVFWVACTIAGIASGQSPSVGASGGIAGMLGLLLMLGRVQGRNVPVGVSASIRQWVITIAVLNLVLGLSIATVNNYAHLGGFATGVLVGLVLPPVAAVGGRDLRPVERYVLFAVIAVAVVALGFAAQHFISVETGASTPPDVVPA